MGFSSSNGYVPVSIQTMMTSVMENINTQFGTTYTYETFVGTNMYKYFYALIQRLQENEVLTSEIFLYLQDYIGTTNERISRPVATNPGLLEALEDAGFEASIKPMIEADAGELHVCVNVDSGDPDYATTKLAINTIIKNSSVAGVVSQGDQTNSIVLSNGQSFDFKYNLPDETAILLKLTIVTSENNQVVISDPEDIKQLLFDNINERYGLGKNFEPQRYFGMVDAPWAASILLEYSIDAGSNWITSISNAAYDDLYTFGLEDITLVES